VHQVRVDGLQEAYMKMCRSFLWIFLSVFFVFTPITYASSEDFNKLWFSGSIEEAFAKAKSDKKPMLLYWGAVWCPPCNVLKSQIFNRPEFQAITEPVLRVYLDGDTAAAQKWGDTLHASGYPTLLLLSSDGSELFRISNSVNWDEFKETWEAALAAHGSFADALESAQKTDASRSVWRLLAYTHWYPEDIVPSKRAELLALREKLIAKIPSEYIAEKALLISGLLDEVSSLEDESDASVFSLSGNAVQYMNFLLGTQEAVWSSRDFLVFNSRSVLPWLKKRSESKEFADLCLRWIRAAEFIRTRKLTSPDQRLGSLLPSLYISREFSQNKKSTLAEIKRAVVEAAKYADSEAKSSFERHSIISSAAYMLQEVGEREASRRLLLKELKQTDTPWYYQSSLASLEEKEGDKKQALVWSHLAKESAKGNATRLQWITNDLLLNLRLAPQNAFAVNKLLREYYDLAFSLPDGFKGRNARRARSVRDALKKVAKKEALQETLEFYKERCKQNSMEKPETCKKIFAFSSKT